MESPVLIELLSHKDEEVATGIHALFQASYRAEAELIGVTDFPPLHRASRDIRRSDTLFWGCRNSSGLTGVIEVRQENSALQISSLAVVPTLFRQGVGSGLVNHVLSALNWQTAEVQTAAANTPALGLYRRLGFCEQRRWLAKEGVELVSFIKQGLFESSSA